jgi:hypothetical protein
MYFAKVGHTRHDGSVAGALFQIHWKSVLLTAEPQPLPMIAAAGAAHFFLPAMPSSNACTLLTSKKHSAEANRRLWVYFQRKVHGDDGHISQWLRNPLTTAIVVCLFFKYSVCGSTACSASRITAHVPCNICMAALFAR